MSNLAPVFVLTPAALAGSASAQSLPPKLQPLSIAAGMWLYHGADMAAAGQKAGNWVWFEDCGWAANKAIMACSFTMNGPGDKVLKSLAISTYNADDKSYWHYEAFASGGDGGNPFIARMAVSGNTWTYDGKAGEMSYRVIYHYDSPTKVTLRIEGSKDRVHWTVMARGEGRKQR